MPPPEPRERYSDYLYHALGIDQLSAQLAEQDQRWAQSLPQQMRSRLENLNHGDLPHWLALLDALPEAENISLTLDQEAICIDCHPPLGDKQREQLRDILIGLKPWRKGPWRLFSIDIDSEWRSDRKWARLAGQIDLKHKRILDVGCANGYFGWRMLGAGAKSVVGIEPSWLFIIQFLLVRHYAAQAGMPGLHTLLPCRLEDLPNDLACFDTVFSMGVLYHRRSPFDHLFELKQCLRPGGELVLETLVIPDNFGQVLVPHDRYANMRNVWFLPSSNTLCDWLARAGFTDIQKIDESQTTPEEQRKTQWLKSQSLEHGLDPKHPNLTVEGYPAPRRAIILARRP